MTSLNIQTKASTHTIDAIKALLLSIDPEAIITDTGDEFLNKPDLSYKNELGSVLRAIEGKTMQMYSLDDFKANMSRFMTSKGII